MLFADAEQKTTALHTIQHAQRLFLVQIPNLHAFAFTGAEGYKRVVAIDEAGNAAAPPAPSVWSSTVTLPGKVRLNGFKESR